MKNVQLLHREREHFQATPLRIQIKIGSQAGCLFHNRTWCIALPERRWQDCRYDPK